MIKTRALARTQVYLLLTSSVFLIIGSMLLFKPELLSSLWRHWQTKTPELQVTRTPATPPLPTGKFVAQRLEQLQFSENHKTIFSLLLAHYLDQQNLPRSAILFPAASAEQALTSPTSIRQSIWQEAAQAISQHAAADALLLSWWDDGQRIHFLTGFEPWLSKPAEATFTGTIWPALRADLSLATAAESQRLQQMAGWLTMEAEQALSAMSAQLAQSRPVYLVLTNDLLLRLSELAAYGGSDLAFTSKHIPSGKDLHADIAQVQRWAEETGAGNYLVQKEGQYYRVWTPANPQTKQSLLVRLLPFVDSLKQLPKGVERVYQSGNGGYLSIYRVTAH